jgi:hypothetical protein
MRFKKSADTMIIENILSECKVGETVTYNSLSAAIGRDVRKFAMSALATARKTVMVEHNIVFDVEHNVGYVRLAGDAVVVCVSEYDRMRIQRTSKRSLQKLATVKFDELNDEHKRKHVVASAMMGAVAMFSHKSASKKIEAKVTNATSSLPIGETLKLFQ